MSDDDNIVLLRLSEMRGDMRSLREHIDATFSTREELRVVRDEVRDIRARVSSIQVVLEAQTEAINQLRVTANVTNKFVARLDDDVDGLQQRTTRLEDKTGG